MKAVVYKDLIVFERLKVECSTYLERHLKLS